MDLKMEKEPMNEAVIKGLEEVDLVAIDLDGTLLNAKKEVSEENRQAILAAKAAGIRVVICSGRPLQGVKKLLKLLDLEEPDDLVITYNGGLIQRTGNGQVLFRQGLSKSDVTCISQLAQAIDLPLIVLDEAEGYQFDTASGKESHYMGMMPVFRYDRKTLDDFNEDHQFCKALLAYDLEALDAAIEKIPSEMKERFNMFKSRETLFEIVPKGVDKGQALRHLSLLLDLPLSHMMAIGDQSNDLPMLSVCGWPVAMANGIDDVKAIAKLTTSDNESSGVAKVLWQVIEARRKTNGTI